MKGSLAIEVLYEWQDKELLVITILTLSFRHCIAEEFNQEVVVASHAVQHSVNVGEDIQAHCLCDFL